VKDILIAIQTVAEGLGPLLSEVVFVGGAVTLFYIDSNYAEEPRPTTDIDCVIEVIGRVDYAELEEKLRSLGFINDREVICRWHYKKIVVDVMPTDPTILGFSNRWYKDGLKNTLLINLAKGIEIKLLSLDYFICAKLEAHASRGASDPRQSKDLEDIFYIY
jgi:predicted nucleotidyltransferase